MTKEKLSELLAKAYSDGFQDGVGAVELSIEDGEESVDEEEYSNVDEVVEKIVSSHFASI